MAESIQSLGVAGGFRTTPTFDLGDLKPIDPNARATLGGFAEPTTLDAGGAKLIDLTAREQLGGFKNPGDEFDDAPPEADPGNEFDTVDDLDARTVEDLDKDRDNFDPVSYFDANPDVAENPDKLSKLLAVRRLRDKEGLVASRVVKAAVKDPIGAIKKFGVGVRDFGANVIDVALQPTANVVLGAVTGELADPQRRGALFSQTRKDLKKSVAEIDAAAESEALGFVDLSRQGLRKTENPLSRIPDDLPRTRVGTANVAPDKPKTDQDLLQEISDDVAFRKQASEVLRGEGEMAKKWGLDQTTLAKEGITLDKEAIENISLVGPLTMVASAGVYTLVGAGGKVLATARSLEGIQKASAGLKNIANNVIGRPIQAAGKVTSLAGEAVRSPGVLTATSVGSVMSGQGIPESLMAGIALKGAAEAAKFIGPKIEAAGAKIAAGGSTAINTLTDLAGKGLKVAEAPALGALATAPLAVMTDDDQAAGATLQAGAIFGAGAGAAKAGGSAFQVVKTKAARELFGPNRKPMVDVNSPDYGRVPELDEMTRVEGAKLTPQNRADLNNFREALRNQGGEIYVVNKETFRSKVADTFAAETGKELTPEALANYERHHAFFDEFPPSGQKIVYLNSDTTGLLHDSGHIFDALLSPEKQAELNAAIDKSFTPEQIAEFQSKYEKAVGNKISADDAKKEYRAELFGALFNNVPVTDLAAPKSLLKSFAGIAAEGAEALGIDLTGGARTPNLQAGQTVGLRSAFEYAARDVLKQGKEVPPPSAPPTPPPTDGGTPTPPVTPTPTSPIAGTTAPNIRVSKAQQDSFSHRNAETGIARARELAGADPETSARVEEISASLEAGNPVLEISHLGIVSEQPAAGRRTRVGEQEGGYAELDRLQIENRAEAPASVISRYQKTFSPVRWVEQGGNATLIASSMDKVISNITKVAKESVGKGVDDILPYPVAEGKFTEAAWDQIMKDNVAYSENQANGYRGDGKKLVRPGVDVGLSLPSENPNYTPTILSDEVMNFQNLIQGLNTPATAREVRGTIPSNVRAQVLAEANKRTLLEPASIRPRNVGKQDFVSFPGRKVAEVNPLRRDLIAKGVDIDSLLPATERLRAKDIVSVKPRPELTFRAAQTDITRAGFLPAPTEFRQKNLGGKTVSEFLETILNSSPEEWKSATDSFTGGLTGGAWNLGLGLKEAADVGVLKNYQEKLSAATKEAMAAGDFDKAYSYVSKAQFAREALEASTGTGSAGAAFKRGTMGTEGVKIPFPTEEPKK